MLTALLFLSIVALLGMAYHGTASHTQTSFPAWLKDDPGHPNLQPGGVVLDKTAAGFTRRDAVTVTVNGIVAQGATAIPLDPVATGPIPKGTVLSFGGTKQATLTAAAVAGANSLAVAAIPTALADNDTATYAGVGKRVVREATLIGRTYAERDAGAAFGPWAENDTEVFLTQHDVPDLDMSAEVAVVRPERLIAYNLLPGWAARPSGEKDAIRATFQTMKGQP